MSKDKPIVQVFIATYNRASLVSKAINSVTNQTFKSIEIIISDNSTNDETKKVIDKINDKRLRYVRRFPSLPPISHFNTILTEVESELFMIFHDDDVMLPKMIERLHKAIQEDISLIAVGANAYRNINNKTTNKLCLNTDPNDLIITDKVNMANNYLKVEGGIVPFPSYLYRKKVAETMHFNLIQGGKYCDAAFIINLLSHGHVKFLTDPLMIYYVYGSQDSQTNNFLDRLKLIKFFQQSTGYTKDHFLIRRYRIMNVSEELREKLKNKNIRIFSKRYFKLFFIYVSSFGYVKGIKFTISNLVKIFLQSTF